MTMSFKPYKYRSLHEFIVTYEIKYTLRCGKDVVNKCALAAVVLYLLCKANSIKRIKC